MGSGRNVSARLLRDQAFALRFSLRIRRVERWRLGTRAIAAGAAAHAHAVTGRRPPPPGGLVEKFVVGGGWPRGHEVLVVRVVGLIARRGPGNARLVARRIAELAVGIGHGIACARGEVDLVVGFKCPVGQLHRGFEHFVQEKMANTNLLLNSSPAD